MDGHKGQMMLFVVIGMVVLVALGSAVAFLKYKADAPAAFSQADAAQVYIQSCIQGIADTAIKQLMRQGGFIYEYDDVFATEFEVMAYHSTEISPNNAYVESELEKFLESYAPICVFNTTFEISAAGSPKADARIHEKRIIMDLEYPLQVQIEERTHTISKFEASSPSALSRFMQARDIVVRQLDQGQLDLSALDHEDINISILPYDNANTIILLEDYTTDQAFQFAVRTIAEVNSPPYAAEPGQLTAFVDEIFNYTFQAFDPDDDPLRFEDRTSIFDIDPEDGVISFLPSGYDEGEFEIPIIISDGTYQIEKTLLLRIVQR